MAFYIHIGMILDGGKESNYMLDTMIHEARLAFDYKLRLMSELFWM